MVQRISGKWRMRCSQGKTGCGKRFTLKRHPHLYKHPQRCPHCHSLNIVEVEQARREEDSRRIVCNCGKYSFPHRSHPS